MSDGEYSRSGEGKKDWRIGLQRTEGGRVKATNFNIIQILENSAVDDSFVCFDEFYSTEFLRATPPWSSEVFVEPRAIKDSDVNSAVHWFSSKWAIEVQQSKVRDALIEIGQKNRSHVIRDYLARINWDGVERLDTWLATYLNAKEDPRYLKVVGRKMILAMVYRVFDPGCKWDQIVILKGGQGVGKSTALETLASSKWFTDKLGDISNKDTLMIMHRHWLIEIGELDSMRKADIEEFKLFASMKVDEFRKPYGHATESYPRQSIMVGTTNKDEFLVDETGNRRFWPLTVGESIDLKGLKKIRNQLFAEAKCALEIDEPLWFEDPNSEDAREFYNLAKSVQNDFTVSDEWESEVIGLLNNPSEDLNLNGFTMMQLWAKMQNFGIATPGSLNQSVAMRLGKILRRLGFSKKSSSILSKGKDQKVWFKIRDEEEDAGY